MFAKYRLGMYAFLLVVSVIAMVSTYELWLYTRDLERHFTRDAFTNVVSFVFATTMLYTLVVFCIADIRRDMSRRKSM